VRREFFRCRQCVKEIIKLVDLIKNQIMIVWFDFDWSVFKKLGLV
jgi:hypothetical protein